MQGGILVDIVIVLLALMFAINGYRQGFIIGVLGFIGFFGGALLGVQVAPVLVRVTEAPAARVLIALLVVFGIAMLGQWGGSALGVRLRKQVTNNLVKRFDEFGGAIVAIVAVMLVAWVVAAPLASSGVPGLAAAVRNSAIVRTIDENMPGPAQNVYNALRSAVNTNGFPEVFSGLDPTRTTSVDPPDPELANSKVVKDAEASVLRVSGEAPQCDRHIEGSSFVYDADRDLVLTNAHVVAGTESVSVAGPDGDVEARVVVFDDQRDLAVLYAPGLNAPELDILDEPADTGTDTIVLGYPQGGPYTATASRVREHQKVTGPDIYDDDEVTREVYSLRAQVRSGNSGGPLISDSGDVYGVIFAAAVDDPETGYAVTMDEAKPVMDEGRQTTESVSTKGCT